MKKETKKKIQIMEILEEELRKHVLSLNLCSTLEKAALYTLELPGKRLRPTFLMTSALDFDVEEKIALRGAVAVEMMHTASLIHDDLPAIDNDDYRRGKPSNHVMFGEDTAIMAGDLLFVRALDICNELGDPSLSNAFSRTLIELVDGEMRDIAMSKANGKNDDIVKMYKKKTGALFAFAFSFGPRLKGKNVEKYEEAGYDFGISFQIFDDIADINSTFEEIGKTPHKDLKQHKSTLVQRIGVEESKKFADTLYRRVLENLKDSPKLLSEIKNVEDTVRRE